MESNNRNNDESATPPPDSVGTRQRILNEAYRLFLRNGFIRSTTRAIAAAAGITEVTLFRHFPSKEKLFEEAVRHFGGPSFTGHMDSLFAGNDYREELLVCGKALMEILWERREQVRLMLCEVSRFPELRETAAENPRSLRRSIQSYLERMKAAGKVRGFDTAAAAQAFLGSLFSYAILGEFLADPAEDGIAREAFVETITDIFVRGTTPGNEP